jgi:hypothetical protein
MIPLLIAIPPELQAEVIGATVAAILSILGGSYFASLPMRYRILVHIANAAVSYVAREYVSPRKEANETTEIGYDLTAKEEQTAHGLAISYIEKKALASPLTANLVKNRPKIESILATAVQKHKSVMANGRQRAKGFS